MEKRSVSQIALEISKDWKNMSQHARPYLEAMLCEYYGVDGEKDVITRFLCNAQTWRGETARRIKLELNNLIK